MECWRSSSRFTESGVTFRGCISSPFSEHLIFSVDFTTHYIIFTQKSLIHKFIWMYCNLLWVQNRIVWDLVHLGWIEILGSGRYVLDTTYRLKKYHYQFNTSGEIGGIRLNNLRMFFLGAVFFNHFDIFSRPRFQELFTVDAPLR